MTTSEQWQAECARLRAELEATERARFAAEEERDAALELVAPDAVAVARQRDDRDAARLAALLYEGVLRVWASRIAVDREPNPAGLWTGRRCCRVA